MLHIYTDGGNRTKREKPIASIGVVWLEDNSEDATPIKEYAEAFRDKTNNQMELLAPIIGLNEAISRGYTSDHVRVYADSAYVINCFKAGWYKNWRRNGWISSSGEPVKNQELWKVLLDLVEKFDQVEFVKVKGHSGDKWNERADELCNIAMDELQSKLEGF